MTSEANMAAAQSGDIVAEHLNDPVSLRADIRASAEVCLEEYGHTVQVRDVAYECSLGTEHYREGQDIEGAPVSFGDEGKVALKLYRLSSKKNENQGPILLAVKGRPENPIATIYPGDMGAVTYSADLYADGDDVEKLKQVMRLVSEIEDDSREKLAEAKFQRSEARRKRKGRAKKTAAYVVVAALSVTGIQEGVSRYDSYREEKDRAEELVRLQLEADQLAEEQRVQEFDDTVSVEGSQDVQVGESAGVQASNEFDEQSVPEYGDTTLLSEETATDLEGPRSFDVSDIGETSCDSFEISINPEEIFYVVHDGGDRRTVSVYFDAETGKFTVCNHGHYGESGTIGSAKPENIIIERASQ